MLIKRTNEEMVHQRHIRIYPFNTNFILILIVGTPPPDNTWRASLSEATPSGLPKRTRGALPIRTPQGRHTALSDIIPERCSILPGPIIRIIDCSEQALLSHPRQPATAHVPPPAGRKDRSDGKSPPTISDSHLQGDNGPTTTLRTS